MKKFSKILLVIIFTIFITGCGEKNHLKEISYKEYEKMIDNNETFIVEIMRTDCSACISFKPTLTRVLNDYDIDIKYINTDHLSDTELEQLFADTGIDGTPTILFYVDGAEETVASRLVGNASYEKVVNKFKANKIINE